ncbi:MAG: co-chaperone DjlA [Pseudomonadota bacterium]
MFKLLGVVIGYLLYGFFGALLGYMLGSLADRYKAYGAGGINPLGNARRQAVFLETVFVGMGKLAKADGHISQDEIAYAEQFMHKLGMTAEHRQQAIAQFKRGAAPDFDIQPVLQQFVAVCGNTHQLKHTLLVYLIVMALSDGHIHPAEETLLKGYAANLGYDQAAFAQLFDMVVNQTRFASGQPDSAGKLEEAYKALGIKPDSSDAEVKRAHRKLMSQYHPDKLMGQGLPADMIAVATEQAKEVQLAYDLIKKSRNL